ncbi:hypothetical protein J7L68_05135 [bacterium]|nr:hypothetical protein [bacterium]
MGYRFDDKGFMIIPDPREIRREREIAETNKNECIIVRKAFCPNGHNLIDEYVNFNGFAGIRLKISRPNGDEGEMVLSPIFGDQSIVYIGIKPQNGEKLDIFCPECGEKLPIIQHCEYCENGDIIGLSLDEKFDITNGIAFCDVVGCPSSYIVDSDELIEKAYLETR